MTPNNMLSDDDLRAILDGSEGTTPGPWCWYDALGARYVAAVDEFYGFGSERYRNTVALTTKNYGPDTSTVREGREDANAAHIARLSPERVKSIVSELLSLRARRSSEPRYWALWSPSGMHIGLWTERALAEQAAVGFSAGYRIEPLYTSAPQPLGAGTGETWNDLPGPDLDRVFVAGWQPPHGNVRGYWWFYEDMTDEHGVPMEHPNALKWCALPSPPSDPPAASTPPCAGDGGMTLADDKEPHGLATDLLRALHNTLPPGVKNEPA